MPKSKLHELLLTEGVGTKPTDKPLSSYMAKKIGTKIVSKDTKEPRLSEDQVIAQCIPFLKSWGWKCKTIYTGGIPIGGGRLATNPAKGIMDTLNFHKKIRQKIWIEYKKSYGGVISPEQQEWIDDLKQCYDTVWVISSLKQLQELHKDFEGDINAAK